MNGGTPRRRKNVSSINPSGEKRNSCNNQLKKTQTFKEKGDSGYFPQDIEWLHY